MRRQASAYGPLMTSPRSSRRLFSTAALAALAASSFAAAARAQSAPAAAAGTLVFAPNETAALEASSTAAILSEVMVTARHQTERAQDVPIALSVVSGAEL